MRLIDADAMLARLEEWNTSDSTDKALYNFTLHRVLEQPTIEPQRTGRWELIDDTEFRIPGYRCSVCHCECEDWDKKPTYRFCPNCGARMEEE